MMVGEFSRVRACAASTAARRWAVWLALAACLALFVALRMRGVGHMLMWDEAHDVLAVRALADGSGDGFTKRLWAHPPALPTLSLLLQPLAPGFAERYEMLVMAINACAMMALFLLNRRIYGTTTALWSCFFLAVMPGAIFYDVWIKGGAIVSLATLGAVAALMGGKPLLSGLCLGFALLDKETAVFPCIAVGILALLDRRNRNVKSIGGLAAATLLTSGWWYALLASSTKYYVVFATASDAHGNSWTMPWHQYLSWLHRDAGTAGCVLLILGVLHVCNGLPTRAVSRAGATYAWWPCALLATAYTALSATPAKAPWVLMFQYPALATLQAAGIVGMAGAVGAAMSRFPRQRIAALTVATACAALMLYGAARTQHEQVLRRVWPGGWMRCDRARRIAESINAHVAPGERLLATTLIFHEWEYSNVVSPVFVYYLTNVPRLMMSCQLPFDRYAAHIQTDRLDWTFISPEPGIRTAVLTNCFKARFGIDPIILDDGSAFLYRTTSAYQE